MKKFLVVIIACLLLLLSTPQATKAQWVVYDPSQGTKEYGLDTAAYVAARIAIKKLTAKTVNWINSGFKGNPSYITNPKQFFLDVGDGVASDFLSSSGMNQLCTPFRAEVRLALVKNYLNDNNNYSCTLSILKNNYNSFVNDFRQGGWDGWFEITQNSQNNPYGAYFNAKNSLSARVQTQQGQIKEELKFGNGFLSFKRCPRGQEYIDVYQQRKCHKEEEIVTPGQTISDQLNNSLSVPWDSLANADEFNEIVTALITQLIEQVAGKASGLFGANEKDPAKPNLPTLWEQIRDESQPYANYRITATSGTINCSASGGGGGQGGGSQGGGNGGNGGSATCRSTPGSISGVPAWPLGSGGVGGGGGGACQPYTPDPTVDCTNIDAGRVLAILNNYPPSNNGLRAAISAVQGVYPQAQIIPHPVRLDKITFGNGFDVDVMGGAVGNAGPDGDDSLAEGGWAWQVDCACNRNPSGSPDNNPSVPLPGGPNTYTVTVGINGLGTVEDDEGDACSTDGSGISPTGNPARCSKAYAQNSFHKLTAKAAIGKSFLGWGGACVSFGTADTCFGNVTGNGDVIANFTP